MTPPVDGEKIVCGAAYVVKIVVRHRPRQVAGVDAVSSRAAGVQSRRRSAERVGACAPSLTRLRFSAATCMVCACGGVGGTQERSPARALHHLHQTLACWTRSAQDAGSPRGASEMMIQGEVVTRRGSFGFCVVVSASSHETYTRPSPPHTHSHGSTADGTRILIKCRRPLQHCHTPRKWLHPSIGRSRTPRWSVRRAM